MTDEEADQVARDLIQGFIGPDHKVVDMRAFLRALSQALQAAHQVGWDERAELERPLVN